MNTLIIRVIGLLSILALLAFKSKILPENPTSISSVININQDWEYLEYNTSDIADIQAAQVTAKVNLPHTWNQFDATDMIPGYRRDASWYHKSMRIDADESERLYLYFEGANISTDVFVNGKKAGSHIGGYVGFRIEITSLVQRGQDNDIHIRVDNSYEPEIIPSQKADFFIYGGITRDLWLERKPTRFIEEVRVSTPEVSAAQAKTSVEVMLNGLGGPKSRECVVDLMDNDATIVVSSTTAKLKSGNTVKIDLPILNNPQLWSPNDPSLYTVRIRYYEAGVLADEKQETIGYRWFHFDPHGPFYINGERVILRGTHRHEEHAGYGAAMPNELHRKDMQQIKEVGANFVRLGHYPQDPEVYKACNELGLVVWDEIPWCRGGLGNDIWKSHTRRLLKEQIIQNYNHPSILFWSVGNEIYWMPDFEGGGDKDNLNAFVSELNDISHDLDPSRMTAIRKYYDGADLVDVFSPSIWSGWYAGVYTNYEKTIEKNQKLYPRFLHMEYGGSSHIGRHTETPITGTGVLNEDDWAEVSNQVNIKNIAKSGDWTENYMVDLFDWYLSISENKDDFAGSAQWAFKDFGTPLRPENAIPYMNQKGLVDRDGKPKDAFYVFKSYWSDDPFTYIESHTWTVRTGPKGKSREVNVFSNCEEVELFHNGQSLGVKKKDRTVFPAGGLVWDIPFVEGENRLEAKGNIDMKQVADDNMIVNYTYEKPDSPDHISIHSEDLPEGHKMIIATMVDKDNRRVLDYEKRVYFVEDGNGSFLQDYGTPTRSQVIEMANGRACIEYVPGKGKATIEVRNQDFKGSYLVVTEGSSQSDDNAISNEE